MSGGSREDQGGYHHQQQYNNDGGYQQQQHQDHSYGGGGGGGYNRGGSDRGFGGGRQDRYDSGSSSRYDSRGPQVNESGIHRLEDTVYITNLPQEVTEERLAEHFGTIGIIKTDKKLKKPKIWVYVDKATNLPKGDATLTYDDPPSADAAIQWFGGKEFMGNIIQVSKAERKMTIPPERGSGGFDRRGGGGSGRGGFRDRGDSGRGGHMGGGGNREPREGDWSCDGCGANNFSRRDECFKCHAQKPAGAGGSSSSRGGRGGDRGGDRSNYRDRDNGSSRGGGRDRYDDRGSRGGRDDYSSRKDNSRHERRDRPY